MDACPTGAIGLVEGVARIDQRECIECEACLSACPETAILSVSETVPAKKGSTTAVKTDSRVSVDVSRAARVVPWVGAALAFVGREVLPRLATDLVNSLVRRDSGSMAEGGSDVSNEGEGRRRRFRRRQGED